MKLGQKLLDACRNRDDAQVSTLVDEIKDLGDVEFQNEIINYRDEKGVTPLMVAIENGDGATVSVLLSGNADVNRQDDMTAMIYTVLHAPQEQQCDIAEQLLSVPAHWATLNNDYEFQTARDYAREKGSVEMVELLDTAQYKQMIAALTTKEPEEMQRLLNEQLLRVNAKNQDGNTALMEMAMCGNIPMVTVLINAEADVNATNNVGETALDMVSLETEMFGILDTVNARYGSDQFDRIMNVIKSSENVSVDLQNLNNEMRSGSQKKDIEVDIKNSNGNSLLMETVRLGNWDAVDTLIDTFCADVNYGNSTQNPLTIALQQGNIRIIRLLIDKNAVVPPVYGTALHFAAAYAPDNVVKEVIGRLLEKNTNAEVKNKDGKTYKELLTLRVPIFRAIHDNDLSAVASYISQGGDVNARGEERTTLLIYATQLERGSIVSQLLAAYADPTLQDHNQKNAIYYAEPQANTKIKDKLLMAMNNRFKAIIALPKTLDRSTGQDWEAAVTKNYVAIVQQQRTDKAQQGFKRT